MKRHPSTLEGRLQIFAADGQRVNDRQAEDLLRQTLRPWVAARLTPPEPETRAHLVRRLLDNTEIVVELLEEASRSKIAEVKTYLETRSLFGQTCVPARKRLRLAFTGDAVGDKVKRTWKNALCLRRLAQALERGTKTLNLSKRDRKMLRERLATGCASRAGCSEG